MSGGSGPALVASLVMVPENTVARCDCSSNWEPGGASVIREELTLPGFTDKTLGSTLDLGGGFTFGHRFDLRVTYSMLFGSDNVDSVIGASAGVMF